MQQLEHLFISPDTNEPLSYHPNGKLLSDASQNWQYPVRDGVAYLLSATAHMKVLNSPLHQKLGTSFHYIDHYQKDAEYFDYFAGFESATARHDNARLRQAIIAETQGVEGRILDVGCGSAWVAQHFCPRGIEVFSMDVSTVNPERARQQYPFPNHYGVIAEVYALPFADHAFDCIIAAEVIEHVPDPALFVQHLLRILKPGGKLIITTPYRDQPAYYLCVHCNRPTPQHAHLHVFDEKSLADLLPASAQRLRLEAFSNFYLLKLRTYVLTQFLPFSGWKILDRLANRVKRKSLRLLMSARKGI